MPSPPFTACRVEGRRLPASTAKRGPPGQKADLFHRDQTAEVIPAEKLLHMAEARRLQ